MNAVKNPERAVSNETELAGALHEVSNALTVVLGWVGYARVKAVPGPVRDAINIAYAHAMRGHQVARRAIGAEVPLAESVRSVHNVAADAALAVEREAAAKGVRLIVSPGERDAMVDEAGAALQVLVNLMLNGVAFSPADAQLELRWQIRGSHAHFWVKDEGPGVPRELQNTLFGNGNSLRPGGAGIGLAHSHSLATRNGGRLLLNRSERGASFELVWPTCEAPSQLVQRPPTPTSIEGLQVLVLEDDPAVLTMIEFGLQSRGASVLRAANLEQLREAIRVGGFDVALLDLSPIHDLPAQVLEELRAGRADLPVLLISGSAVSPDVALPFSGWVQKPFELGELYEAIRAVVPPRPPAD
jgi:CheY-like chemotaxis protein